VAYPYIYSRIALEFSICQSGRDLLREPFLPAVKVSVFVVFDEGHGKIPRYPRIYILGIGGKIQTVLSSVN
jgi:hypothetical protein